MVIRSSIHLVVFIALTLLTQIGGLAYILAVLSGRYICKSAPFCGIMTAMAFLILYGSLNAVSALAAPHFGRVSLPCSNQKNHMISMQSPLYCLLNRHYVTPDLEHAVFQLAAYMNTTFPGTVTIILDAGFPFFDGFPLLPHLSHHDGRKLDLAFFYLNENAAYMPGKTKSPIGYWAFEEPAPESPQPCANRNDWLTLRWDMKWFAPLLHPLKLDKQRTSAALQWLSSTGQGFGVTKILLEPHLKDALDVDSDRVRFQGCRAARHDDHIHIEIGETD